MMELRRLTAPGVEAFRAYLSELRIDPTLAPPRELLTDPSVSEALRPALYAEPATFPDRMTFCRWLHSAAEAAGSAAPISDPGFWPWLSLALFDQVCPPQTDNSRRVQEEARYIAQLSGVRRYYRHSLLGPYLVFRQFLPDPDRALVLLCGQLSRLADEAYRLFVENQLASSEAAVEVLTRLYFDPATRSIRRGAQTKSPGAIRRFAKIVSQYARTFDLDLTPAETLLSMLPPEFGRWHQPATSARR